MKKIVACVPNFSEGRNTETIEAITLAIRETPGCRVLDVDPGASTHRTVYTFVGDPEAVVEGALAAARVAGERIDMRRHSGEHPRFGAMDVCPFVPVSGVTMEDCARIAEHFGRKLAEALSVPVFLYEAAARTPERRKLPDVRRGEYEALAERLKDPRWKPDFGPAAFVPTWGATAAGARMFLIAYNVNILGTPNQAHRIALDLREAGRGPDQPGKLKDVKGMGWFVAEHNLAQVTVNLNNYHVTPIHVLFEEVKAAAARLGVGVAGSEIVGVVPLEAIMAAADHYIEKEGLFVYEDDRKIRLAVERLGLNAITPFTPEEKIIEYRVAEAPDEPLAGMPLRGFVESVADRSTAPGGGSVAAAVAAMGVGLAAMTAKLTYGVRKFEKVDAQMRRIIPPLHEAARRLIPMIDADTTAYNDYVAALRLSGSTPEDRENRRRAIQQALKAAVAVPLETMLLADAVWDAFKEAARSGNPACRSDLQVGAKALETGIYGACCNVFINLADIEDETYKNRVTREADALRRRAAEAYADILKMLA